MKLSDIEEHIEPIIFKRGIGYLNYDNIQSVKKETDQLYRFIFKGSAYYEVVVTLKEDLDTIEQTECSCPYDKGPFCKHQVAAFLYIRIKMNDKKENEEMQGLTDVLAQLDRDRLMSLLLILFRRYPSERDKFMGTVKKSGKKEDPLPPMYTIVDIIEAAKDHTGFISYYETMDLTDELQDLLEKIEEANPTYEKLKTLLFFYTEATQLIDCCDDSGGSIGILLNSILDALNNTLDTYVFSDKEEQLTLLVDVRETVKQPVFRAWSDYAIQLLSQFVNILSVEDVRLTFLDIVDEKIESLDDLEKEYVLPQLLLIKAAVIKLYESDEAYVEFLNKHKEFHQITESLMHFLLEKNQYQNVLKLLAEMKERGQQTDMTTTLQYAYEAYRGVGDEEKTAEVAIELLLRGEQDYYQQTRDVVSNPKVFYQKVKDALRARQPDLILTEVYKNILIMEEDWSGLLELVGIKPSVIVSAAPLLKPHYPKETDTLYTRYLLDYADTLSTRKQYKQLAVKIRQYGQIVGVVKQNELVETIKEAYPRKSALIEELGKVS